MVNDTGMFPLSIHTFMLYPSPGTTGLVPGDGYIMYVCMDQENVGLIYPLML